jgi:hypothetical protein
MTKTCALPTNTKNLHLPYVPKIPVLSMCPRKTSTPKNIYKMFTGNLVIAKKKKKKKMRTTRFTLSTAWIKRLCYSLI